MANEIKIDSFKILCDTVNNSNIEVLAVDLAQWLITYNNVISKIRKDNPEQTKGLSNSEIAEGAFVWIDDGKNDLKGITVKLK